jgi:hypothetical protein
MADSDRLAAQLARKWYDEDRRFRQHLAERHRELHADFGALGRLSDLHAWLHNNTDQDHDHPDCEADGCGGQLAPTRNPEYRSEPVAAWCMSCAGVVHPAACYTDNGTLACVCNAPGVAEVVRNLVLGRRP